MKKLIYLFILVLNIGYSQDLKKVNGVTDTNVKKVATISDTNIKKVNGVTFNNATFTGLLDDYAGAGVAYSVARQLKGTATYAFKVRRTSDNTELDIGFVDGLVDVASLETFCSGTDGYVRTLYDQSGNSKDATTTSNAHKIVSSGVVVKKNGQPVMEKVAGTALSVTLVLADFSTSNANYSIGAGYWTLSGSTEFYEVEDYHSGGDGVTRFGITTGVTCTGNYIYYGRDNPGDCYTLSPSAYTSRPLQSEGFVIEGLITSSTDDCDLWYKGINTDGDNTSYAGVDLVSATEIAKYGFFHELIIYPSNQSSSRVAIYTNLDSFYLPKLLDKYAGAGAAYSVRKINSNYSGYCMRVKRSSDNTTQDIGFEADGDLDVAAIATFCGANNGHIDRLYDQSGNGYNLVPQNATDFLIYTSSAVTLKNGKPSIIRGAGGGDLYATVTLSTVVGSNAFYGVSTYTHRDNSGIGSNIVSTENFELYAMGGTFDGATVSPTGYLNVGASSSIGTHTFTDGDQVIFEYLKVSASQDDVYVDGSQKDSGNAGSTSYSPAAATPKLYVGGAFLATGVEIEGIQELILYSSNQNSNRSGIYANVAAYF